MVGLSLPPVSYVICVCLRTVVSNAYCVVFLFDVRRHVYPMLQVTLDCQYLIAPSVFFKFLFNSIYMYVNRVVGGGGVCSASNYKQ